MPLLVNSYDAQVFIPADGILLNCNEIFYFLYYTIFFLIVQQFLLIQL